MNFSLNTVKQIELGQNEITGFKKNLLLIVCVAAILLNISKVNAQGIIISQRSSLILNGDVALVLNNTSLKNNGSFAASTGTVKFTGHTDTVESYIAGENATTFFNLSVTKSAYGVALKSAVAVRNTLAVNGGNLYTDSNLTLKSDATLTARVDEVPAESNIIGKTNVERYIPVKRSWRMITAPVCNSNSIFNSWQNGGVYTKGIGTLVTGPNPTGAKGNGLDVSAQNTISLKGWNFSTQAFANITNTHAAVSPGKRGSADNTGYFMFIRGDRDPKNTNVSYSNITTLTASGDLQTGIQTFAASSTKNGYTLIGNPYASPVDFRMLTIRNLVNRFYVWDPALNDVGGYVMMDDLDNDGHYVKSIIVSSNTNIIQSGQAFFVQTRNTGEASIIFNEKAKSSENNNYVFRPETPETVAAGTGEIRAILNLLNANNSTIVADGVIAEFDSIYSKLVDNDDAVKFGNVNENLAILRSNASLVAERRPSLSEIDTLQFKLTKLVQRNYQFEFTAAGFNLPGMSGFLQDNYLKTSTPVALSGTTTVNFVVNAEAASIAADRFKIIFKVMETLPVTLTNVTAYAKNDAIAVEWTAENEINMEKYEVERSVNGSSFTKATTTIVTGNNNAFNKYKWLDVNPAQGNNFYRIKSYDKSGKISYSSIVKVTTTVKESGFAIYPNPVTGNVINLQVNNQPTGTYQLRLTNIAGQTLYTNSINNIGGNSVHSLQTASKLATGIYQLEIAGPNNIKQIQQVMAE